MKGRKAANDVGLRATQRGTVLANRAWRRRVALRELMREIASLASEMTDQRDTASAGRSRTTGEWNVLCQLRDAGTRPIEEVVAAPASQGDGAAVLHKLADEGLVELVPNPCRADRPGVRLTPTGEYRVFDAALPDVDPIAQAREDLRPEELEAAVRVVRSLRSAFGRTAPTPEKPKDRCDERPRRVRGG